MKKILKVLGIIFLAIIGLGVIVYFIPLPGEEPDADKETEKTEIRNYTDDQKKFVYSFGKPNSWELTFNQEDEPTLEVWKYIELGETITFGDGNFIDRIEYKFPVPENSVIMDAKIEPKDVYNFTTLEELNDLLETEPSLTADINDEIWEGAKFHSYDDIIIAGTIDDKLVFVKTQSYSIDLGEEADSASDATNSIHYKNATYGFSLELPSSWTDYKIEEENYSEYGTAFLNFSLPTDDPMYEDVGGRIIVFSIEVYSENPEGDVIFAEYAGQNDNYFIYYSHLNGVPSENDDPRIWQFPEILETLKVY